MDRTQRAKLYDAVDRVSALPMLILALVFLPVFAVPLLLSLNPAEARALETVGWFIWAAFAVELVLKTYLAPRRWRYVYTHWYDVVIVVIPFFRPLRAVRALRGLRELELLRLGSVGVAVSRHAKTALRRHGLSYALTIPALIVVAAAIAEMMFERDTASGLGDLGTALWFAVTTVTTVGYGDVVPKSPEGRGIAVFLMLVGVSAFSFVTANIAAYLVQVQREESTEPTMRDVMTKLEALEARLNEPARL